MPASLPAHNHTCLACVVHNQAVPKREVGRARHSDIVDFGVRCCADQLDVHDCVQDDILAYPQPRVCGRKVRLFERLLLDLVYQTNPVGKCPRPFPADAQFMRVHRCGGHSGVLLLLGTQAASVQAAKHAEACTQHGNSLRHATPWALRQQVLLPDCASTREEARHNALNASDGRHHCHVRDMLLVHPVAHQALHEACQARGVHPQGAPACETGTETGTLSQPFLDPDQPS